MAVLKLLTSATCFDFRFALTSRAEEIGQKLAWVGNVSPQKEASADSDAVANLSSRSMSWDALFGTQCPCACFE